jgi:hypothetical protein
MKLQHKLVLVCAAAFAVLAGSGLATDAGGEVRLTNSWRGITPLRSSAADVAVLASKLGSPGFLTTPTQAQFFAEKRPSNGRSTGYGLGFEVADSPLGRFVAHKGNVVGGTAFALAHLESRVAIGMTTNVGWVTVRRPPKLGPSVPDPPQLLIPFVMADWRHSDAGVTSVILSLPSFEVPAKIYQGPHTVPLSR